MVLRALCGLKDYEVIDGLGHLFGGIDGQEVGAVFDDDELGVGDVFLQALGVAEEAAAAERRNRAEFVGEAEGEPQDWHQRQVAAAAWAELLSLRH